MHRRTSRVNSGRGKKLSFPPPEEETNLVSGPQVAARQAICSHMVSQTDPELELAASPQPSLTDVMVAIATYQAMLATCQAMLTTKIKAIQQDVDLL